MNYQLAVQALCVDTKLHKLYDESCHKGKNEMDFLPPGLASTPDLPSSENSNIAPAEGPFHAPSGTLFSPSSNMSVSNDEHSDRME